jgi:hypothetical protein
MQNIRVPCTELDFDLTLSVSHGRTWFLQAVYGHGLVACRRIRVRPPKRWEGVTALAHYINMFPHSVRASAMFLAISAISSMCMCVCVCVCVLCVVGQPGRLEKKRIQAVLVRDTLPRTRQ